ncbi:MAG: hypothetical protein K1X82_10625 [Bacteroidia bacterium]|nr:hypothetical protein [Bacteroidia bacterium]
MNALFALLLSLNMVSSSQQTTLSKDQQVSIAVKSNVTTYTQATTLVNTVWDPNEGRTKN